MIGLVKVKTVLTTPSTKQLMNLFIHVSGDDSDSNSSESSVSEDEDGEE